MCGNTGHGMCVVTLVMVCVDCEQLVVMVCVEQ